MQSALTIGVDASNIRDGGGITHLSRLLGAAEPRAFGVERLFVWGRRSTLDALPDRDWLVKEHSRWLELPLPFRVFWQQAVLPAELRRSGCGFLFSPGGTTPAASPVPAVVMSQNLLPFEPAAMAAYPAFSPFRAKIALLKKAQARSMRSAAGLIFLSEYAKRTVLAAVRPPAGVKAATIPHGLEERFFCRPRPPVSAGDCSDSRPFRVLYVSSLDKYKHQEEAARAVAGLRGRGLPVALEFAGFPRSASAAWLQAKLRELDPGKRFLTYRGTVPFEELPLVYRGADLFLFASACENLPNTLLEAMASGLPVISSDRGPMPEVLGDAGKYFNPEAPEEIAEAIAVMLGDAGLRASLAERSYARAREYSWEKTARETFAFMREVYKGGGTHAIH